MSFMQCISTCCVMLASQDTRAGQLSHAGMHALGRSENGVSASMQCYL